MTTKFVQQGAPISASNVSRLTSELDTVGLPLYRMLAVLAVMVLALSLRLANLPGSTESRNFDETGYLSSGLVMFEGMSPGYKASPAATEIWFSWLSAAYETARSVPSAKAALGTDASIKTLPFVAIDYALGKLYADLSGLTRAYLIWSALISQYCCRIRLLARYRKGREGECSPYGFDARRSRRLPAGPDRLGRLGKTLLRRLVSGFHRHRHRRDVGRRGPHPRRRSCSRPRSRLPHRHASGLPPSFSGNFSAGPQTERKPSEPAISVAALAIFHLPPRCALGLDGPLRCHPAYGHDPDRRRQHHRRPILVRPPPGHLFVLRERFPLALLGGLALVLMINRLRWCDWLLLLYAGFLLVIPFLGYRQDFRYHGASIIAMLSVGALLVIWWARTLPHKIAWLIAVAVLAMPLLQSVFARSKPFATTASMMTPRHGSKRTFLKEAVSTSTRQQNSGRLSRHVMLRWQFGAKSAASTPPNASSCAASLTTRH